MPSAERLQVEELRAGRGLVQKLAGRTSVLEEEQDLAARATVPGEGIE
ncbi:hypothetical protein [Paenibacillus sp. YN15]|nr:hypothetical protein [Paenibacillus sp. YN15]